MVLVLAGCAELIWDTRTFNCDDQKVCLSADGPVQFIDQGEVTGDPTCRVETTGVSRVTRRTLGCFAEDDDNAYTLSGVASGRGVSLNDLELEWLASEEAVEETWIELGDVDPDPDQRTPQLELLGPVTSSGDLVWDGTRLSLTCTGCSVVAREIGDLHLTLNGTASAVVCSSSDNDVIQIDGETTALVRYVGTSSPSGELQPLLFPPQARGAPEQCSY